MDRQVVGYITAKVDTDELEEKMRRLKRAVSDLELAIDNLRNVELPILASPGADEGKEQG